MKAAWKFLPLRRQHSSAKGKAHPPDPPANVRRQAHDKNITQLFLQLGYIVYLKYLYNICEK